MKTVPVLTTLLQKNKQNLTGFF